VALESPRSGVGAGSELSQPRGLAPALDAPASSGLGVGSSCSSSSSSARPLSMGLPLPLPLSHPVFGMRGEPALLGAAGGVGAGPLGSLQGLPCITCCPSPLVTAALSEAAAARSSGSSEGAYGLLLGGGEALGGATSSGMCVGPSMLGPLGGGEALPGGTTIVCGGASMLGQLGGGEALQGGATHVCGMLGQLRSLQDEERSSVAGSEVTAVSVDGEEGQQASRQGPSPLGPPAAAGVGPGSGPGLSTAAVVAAAAATAWTGSSCEVGAPVAAAAAGCLPPPWEPQQHRLMAAAGGCRTAEVSPVPGVTSAEDVLVSRGGCEAMPSPWAAAGLLGGAGMGWCGLALGLSSSTPAADATGATLDVPQQLLHGPLGDWQQVWGVGAGAGARGAGTALGAQQQGLLGGGKYELVQSGSGVCLLPVELVD
jgi:hypothetical protein